MSTVGGLRLTGWICRRGRHAESETSVECSLGASVYVCLAVRVVRTKNPSRTLVKVQ